MARQLNARGSARALTDVSGGAAIESNRRLNIGRGVILSGVSGETAPSMAGMRAR